MTEITGEETYEILHEYLYRELDGGVHAPILFLMKTWGLKRILATPHIQEDYEAYFDDCLYYSDRESAVHDALVKFVNICKLKMVKKSDDPMDLS